MEKENTKNDKYYIESSCINLNKKDYLENYIYSDELCNKIENYFNSSITYPLYIGIVGAWGSGKTSVVETALSKQDKKTKIYKYDAWKYEDDSFRRNFIQDILSQSGLKQDNKVYKKIIESLYEDYSINFNSIIERMKLSEKKDTKINKKTIIILMIVAYLSHYVALILVVFAIFYKYFPDKFINKKNAIIIPVVSTVISIISFPVMIYLIKHSGFANYANRIQISLWGYIPTLILYGMMFLDDKFVSYVKEKGHYIFYKGFFFLIALLPITISINVAYRLMLFFDLPKYILYSDLYLYYREKNIIKNKKVFDIIKKYKEIKKVEHFNATPVGYKYQISFTIYVDGNLSTFESHEIANRLEKELSKLDEIYLTVIHVNPIKIEKGEH